MALDLRIHRRVDAAPVGTGHTGSLPWLRPLPPDRKLWATRVPSPGWAVTTLASQASVLDIKDPSLVTMAMGLEGFFWLWPFHLSAVTGLRMSMSANSSSQDSESSQARLKTLSLLQVSLSDVALSFLSHQDSASNQRSTSQVMWITRNC